MQCSAMVCSRAQQILKLRTGTFSAFVRKDACLRSIPKAPHTPACRCPVKRYHTSENSHFCSSSPPSSDVASSPKAHGVRVTTAPSSVDLCSTSRHSNSAGGGVSSTATIKRGQKNSWVREHRLRYQQKYKNSSIRLGRNCC